MIQINTNTDLYERFICKYLYVMVRRNIVINLANLLETRTLCKCFFDRPYDFSDLFNFVPTN